MTTSTYASTVTLIDQRGTGATEAFRCEINDPYTHLYGTGFGDSEREAFNAARVSYQNCAAWSTQQALQDADEGFARIEAQTAVPA